MSSDKRKVPKLRFPGFTEDWEQRKLEELVDRVVRKNTKNESSLPLTISAQYGLVDQFSYFNNRVASRDVSNYYLVLNGEFAYNKSTSDGFPFGAVKRLDLYENGVLSILYIVFSIKNTKKTNSDFLVVYFETDRWHRGVSIRAAEGARNHGLLNISAEEFFDIDFILPKSEEEQAVIGTLMQSLESFITLHQRKLDNTKKLKQGLLQKMFPKNGEVYPEIRFPGFTDPWEQRKALEIFTSVVDKGHHELPVLSASQEKGMILRENIGVSIKYDKKNLESYKRVRPGQFVIHLRSFQGGFAYSSIEGITSPAYSIIDFIAKEKHYPLFWRVLFNSPDFIKRLETVTYGIRDGRSISFTDFSGLWFCFPSFEEQKEIGDYILCLDNLITLHQRQLDNLQTLKKALLQQMFV